MFYFYNLILKKIMKRKILYHKKNVFKNKNHIVQNRDTYFLIIL